VAAVAVSVLAVPKPALADLPPAPNLVANPVAADRDFVRWLSVHDPRATVRSVARSTLLSGGGTDEAAIKAFLTSGYATALDQAAQTRTRQLDYANRMASTHPAQFYPWVNAAALRAASGTAAELAEFSSTGYAAALAKDDAKVPYDDGAAQVTEEDYEVIGIVARTDAAPTVRRRAGEVTTDADVAEFLRYGWVSAAGIDSDSFREQYVAGEWEQWRFARQDTLLAVTADRAARAGTANPSAAIRGWQNVKNRFAPMPPTWTYEQQSARDQVNTWTRNLQFAAGSTGPLWTQFAAKAPAVRTQWVAEVNGAIEQTAWWNNLVGYAAAAADEWLHSDD